MTRLSIHVLVRPCHAGHEFRPGMLPAAAIKAGRNVLCDKPLCLNADEAEDMLAAHKERPDKVRPGGLLL